MSDRRYQNPTIVEAVCELRFPVAKSWGISSFIKFAELAKQQAHPKIVDAAQGFQVNFPIGSSGMPTMTPVANRVQTWNEEGTQLWQASPQTYAANRRAPYQGWEQFRPHLLKGLDLYREVADLEPAEALVMQYINRVEIDAAQARLSDLVLFLPPEIQYADNVNNFICRTEQSFNDGEHIAITSARDLPAQTGIAIILDILYTALQPDLQHDALVEGIEKAHSRVTEAFEKSITDALRERMGPTW